MAASMNPEDVSAEAKAAFNAVVNSGYVRWYLSAGEKVEFTALNFCAWYMAERQRIREQVAREIEAAVCRGGEQCKDRFCPDCIRHGQAKRDARIARGEHTNPTTKEN